MVDQDRKRDYPAYDIDRIRELAANGSLQFGTTKAENDVQNLAYTLEEVCRCLASLESGHFMHAVRYGNTAVWLDVYRRRYPSPKGGIDDLYIKLKLNRSCISVVIQSFHLAQYD